MYRIPSCDKFKTDNAGSSVTGIVCSEDDINGVPGVRHLPAGDHHSVGAFFPVLPVTFRIVPA